MSARAFVRRARSALDRRQRNEGLFSAAAFVLGASPPPALGEVVLARADSASAGLPRPLDRLLRIGWKRTVFFLCARTPPRDHAGRATRLAVGDRRRARRGHPGRVRARLARGTREAGGRLAQHAPGPARRDRDARAQERPADLPAAGGDPSHRRDEDAATRRIGRPARGRARRVGRPAVSRRRLRRGLPPGASRGSAGRSRRRRAGASPALPDEGDARGARDLPPGLFTALPSRGRSTTAALLRRRREQRDHVPGRREQGGPPDADARSPKARQKQPEKQTPNKEQKGDNQGRQHGQDKPKLGDPDRLAGAKRFTSLVQPIINAGPTVDKEVSVFEREPGGPAAPLPVARKPFEDRARGRFCGAPRSRSFRRSSRSRSATCCGATSIRSGPRSACDGSLEGLCSIPRSSSGSASSS